jgi:hypothetical protein
LSQEYHCPGKTLVSLSPLISQSLVPIEDWISTVSYLIARYSDHLKDYEADLLPLFHSTIHSICLACTSPSHVRSLVDEGILGYWETVLQKLLLLKRTSGGGEEGATAAGEGVGVLESITYLTSIDEELSSRIGIDLGLLSNE